MNTYEWGGKDGRLLLRDGARVGEVSPLGTLWVSTVLRPSRRGGQEAGSEEQAVKTASLGEDEARAKAERDARAHWGDVVEELDAMAQS